MSAQNLAAYDIQYFNIDATSGAIIVPSRAGHRIYCINWLLAAAVNVVAQWRSGSSTIIAGAINNGTAGAAPSEAIESGHFRCAVGENLELVLDNTLGVIGSIVVAFVPVRT